MVPRELTIHSSYVVNPNGTKLSAAGASQHRLRQLLTVIADGGPSQPRDHIKRNLPAAQPELPGGSIYVKPPLRRHPRESRPGYIADANVISELMRAEPHPAVAGWVAAQPRAVLYTTHITQAEFLYGTAALPEGRRRTALAAAAEAMFAEDFAGRILPFEAAAASRYPDIVLARRQAGNRIEGFDALIAATALATCGSVATREYPRIRRLRPFAHRSVDGIMSVKEFRLGAEA